MVINTSIGLILEQIQDINLFIQGYNIKWFSEVTDRYGYNCNIIPESMLLKGNGFFISKVIYEPVLELNIILKSFVRVGCFTRVRLHPEYWKGYSFSEIIIDNKILSNSNEKYKNYISYFTSRLRGDVGYNISFPIPLENNNQRFKSFICKDDTKDSLFKQIVNEYQLEYIFNDLHHPTKDEINLFKMLTSIS